MTVTTPFRIEIVPRDQSLHLILQGELDLVTSPLLDAQLTRSRATAAKTIVVDLTHVGFMDSSGLHVLIKHARADGRPDRVRLTKGPPQVQRLFEIAGLVDQVCFCDQG
jgi:anti-anti-sigma factor